MIMYTQSYDDYVNDSIYLACKTVWEQWLKTNAPRMTHKYVRPHSGFPNLHR